MPNWIGTIVSFFYGVPIFFITSGFLIWKSVESSLSCDTFLKKRLFRIYPELWVGVIIELLAILFFYREPIEIIPFGLFAIGQGTIFQFWTPNSLRGYGCGTPNGSLWTICVIIQFYLIVWVFNKLFHKKHWSRLAIMEGVAVCIAIVSPLLEKIIPELAYKLYNQTLIPYLWLFVLGIIISEYFEKIIPFLKKTWPVFLTISATLMLLKFDVNSGYGVLRCSTLGMGLIGFAYYCPKANIKLDFSYGIYIYHMTFVNILIQLGFVGNIWYGIVAFFASLVFAIVSTLTIGKWSSKKRKTIFVN